MVLIRGLSKVTSDDALKDHFRHAHTNSRLCNLSVFCYYYVFSSDYTVLDVQRVYDVHKLHSLNRKK